MATATLMTVEEFAHRDPLDLDPCELVDGELVALPSGTPLHNNICGHLEQLLRNYFDGNSLGKAISWTDCQIGEGVRRPDVSIFLAENWLQVNLTKIPIPFAPDIAVEILSPSESALYTNRKIREYLAAGSREVWLLDAENGEVHIRTATGIRLLAAENTLETPLLPGFAVSVEKLLSAR
jgi:Uma2 family endonuclease